MGQYSNPRELTKKRVNRLLKLRESAPEQNNLHVIPGVRRNVGVLDEINRYVFERAPANREVLSVEIGRSIGPAVDKLRVFSALPVVTPDEGSLPTSAVHPVSA